MSKSLLSHLESEASLGICLPGSAAPLPAPQQINSNAGMCVLPRRDVNEEGTSANTGSLDCGPSGTYDTTKWVVSVNIRGMAEWLRSSDSFLVHEPLTHALMDWMIFLEDRKTADIMVGTSFAFGTVPKNTVYIDVTGIVHVRGSYGGPDTPNHIRFRMDPRVYGIVAVPDTDFHSFDADNGFSTSVQSGIWGGVFPARFVGGMQEFDLPVGPDKKFDFYFPISAFLVPTHDPALPQGGGCDVRAEIHDAEILPA